MDALLAGVLDTPAAPEDVFNDDPLRMLRAARFVSQLGFSSRRGCIEAIVDDGRRRSTGSPPSGCGPNSTS